MFNSKTSFLKMKLTRNLVAFRPNDREFTCPTLVNITIKEFHLDVMRWSRYYYEKVRRSDNDGTKMKEESNKHKMSSRCWINVGPTQFEPRSMAWRIC